MNGVLLKDMQDVDAFVDKMKDKLARAFGEGYERWREFPNVTRCLYERSIEERDFVSVANYAMMMHFFQETKQGEPLWRNHLQMRMTSQK